MSIARKCSVEGCDITHRVVRGLCRNHLYRLDNFGDPLYKRPPRKMVCKLEGCTKKVKGYSKVCSMHYARMSRNGVFDKTKHDLLRHEIHEEDNIAFVVVKGKRIVVDKQDRHLLEKMTWSIDSVGYAVSRGTRLHKVIMNEKNRIVDHINRNTLDNRRSNLRYVTRAENAANSNKRVSATGYRGVYPAVYGESNTQYFVRIARKTIGYYADPKEAAIARDKAAIKMYGKHIFLNFPSEI